MCNIVYINYTLYSGIYAKKIANTAQCLASFSDERVRLGRLELFLNFICVDLMVVFCWVSFSLVLRRYGWSVLFHPHPAGALDRLCSFLE